MCLLHASNWPTLQAQLRFNHNHCDRAKKQPEQCFCNDTITHPLHEYGLDNPFYRAVPPVQEPRCHASANQQKSRPSSKLDDPTAHYGFVGSLIGQPEHFKSDVCRSSVQSVALNAAWLSGTTVRFQVYPSGSKHGLSRSILRRQPIRRP